MEKTYDLIVIGAGPGGYPAAIRAAKAGKKVAVVEKHYAGGTCLNCGCIPTKTYLHTAELLEEVKKASAAGLKAEKLKVSMQELKARKDQVVEELRAGIEKQFSACRIDVYRGSGTVVGEGRVTVAGENRVTVTGEGRVTVRKAETVLGGSGPDVQEEKLTAGHILIAAGSKPSPLPIPGIELPGVENSTTMLERETLYDRLVIIGGGVIGMEFATVYRALGCEVTVLEAMDRILPTMDREISQNLKMIMKKRGVDIHTSSAVSRIERQEDGSLRCIYKEKEKEAVAKADGILVAVGRRPCTDGLFSEACKELVRTDRGRIVVDEHYRTTLPGVYAVGDVIGGIQLAHVATAEGYCALADMDIGFPQKAMAVVPSCVYTDPEIAHAGITADEAKEKGIRVKTGKYIMSVNGKSVLSMQERGFVKLVAEEQSGRILGAELMCARATDMIGELVLAIDKGLTAADLAEIIMPHPTFCEGVGEAAETFAM